jgi:hypothetical protein
VDESKPFEFKYAARDKMNALLMHPLINLEIALEKAGADQNHRNLVITANMVVKSLLGANFFDAEEYKQSELTFIEARILADALPDNIKILHCHSVQDILNHLGIVYSNWEMTT